MKLKKVTIFVKCIKIALVFVVLNVNAATVDPTQSTSTLEMQLQPNIKQTGKRGFLYELTSTKTNKKIFVGGITHYNKATYFPINQTWVAALHQASGLLVQERMGQSKASLQAALLMGSLPAGDSLARYLPKNTTAEVLQALQKVQNQSDVTNQPPQPADTKILMGFRPWLAAATLAHENISKMNYTTKSAAGGYLEALAFSMQLPIQSIDDSSTQLDLLDGQDQDTQTNYIHQTAERINNEKMAEQMRLLVDEGWAMGNVKNIENYIAMETQSGGKWAIFYKNQWLEGHNVNLTNAITTHLKKFPNSKPMVVMQAVNLVGEKGVLAQLVQRGFVVRDLQGTIP